MLLFFFKVIALTFWITWHAVLIVITLNFSLCLWIWSVYADGSICLDILQNQWSPIYDVAAILTSIQVIFCFWLFFLLYSLWEIDSIDFSFSTVLIFIQLTLVIGNLLSMSSFVVLIKREQQTTLVTWALTLPLVSYWFINNVSPLLLTIWNPLF